MSTEIETKADHLNQALKKVKTMEWGQHPLLLLSSMVEFFSCKDWFYLNALLNYISWSNVDYVSLNSTTEQGRKNLEFPDIQCLEGSREISLYKATGTLAGICTLLKTSKNTLVDLTLPRNKISFEFESFLLTKSLF